MTTETFPVLYVLVPNDMVTMNNGKAEAHSGHASSAFHDKMIATPFEKGKKPTELVMEWRKATKQGFGTQINLDANFKQMETAVKVAKMMGFVAELVTDPTYPYEVDAEIAELIPEELDTLPRIFKGSKVIMFREEVTTAFIFGDKNDPMLEAVMGRFRLKP